MSAEDVLRENKRECFDGIRAYHQSEISHTNHAITMLLAVSGAAGAVVLAILFPEKPPAHVHAIAWGLFGTVVALGGTIAWSACAKIESDHASYAAFGAEYVRTCEILGLYSSGSVTVDGTHVTHEPIKTHRTVGQGKGYRKTQRIIWSFAGVIALLTLMFALLVTCGA